jgi:hypothetical protein
VGEGAGAVEAWQKAKEQHLRRRARAAGYQLARCRSRDPSAPGHGTYQILDDGGRIVAGDPIDYGLRLDDVETWLDAQPVHQPRI